jgi:predicted lipoprotein with Yx(FWY)xxD motif
LIRIVALAALVSFGLCACSSTQNASHQIPGHDRQPAAPLVVEVTTTDNPSLGYILTDGNGMTLYHYAPERPGKVECTGGCVSTWPPLTVPPGGRLVSGPGVIGVLGTLRRPDGSVQVTYNGLPLYLFSRDTLPGEASGEGLGGLWTVIQVHQGASESVPLRPLEG